MSLNTQTATPGSPIIDPDSVTAELNNLNLNVNQLERELTGLQERIGAVLDESPRAVDGGPKAVAEVRRPGSGLRMELQASNERLAKLISKVELLREQVDL